MTRKTILIAVGLSLAAARPSQAVTIIPTGDTYVTQHSGLGGPTSNHSSDPKLDAIGTSTFLSYPLYQFDLSAYTGQTVTGPSTLSLYVTSGFGLTSSRTVSLYEVSIGWVPTTATYNNFGPAAGIQFGTDTNATAMDIQIVGGAGMTPQYVSWTVPATVIQNWIDNPAQNHGLLIRNQSGANLDLSFDAVEGTNQPQLNVAVPEPSSVAVLLAFGAGSALLRRRKMR